ncbi:uncharacterized protein EI90DRAFT_3060812 [Cantharellus anzutake]|uniref:uncharacterized protein n=1 Tax=Cantharellus anzutake TaxID=1750568 RepID=UPI0019088CC2|nr:uncharacterized protein EI90DRAFT_3060812 [Cantharellus anzutake]KAF8330457.1 hypothetical protein EI90DRAFT_3060812 [Cantharellus anzutake]
MYQYHKDVAANYNLTGWVHLRHNVTVARWSGNATHGHWELTIRRPRTSLPVTAQEPARFWYSVLLDPKFDHLIVATGQNRYPLVNDFPGEMTGYRAERRPSNPFIIPKPRLRNFDRDAIYFEDGSSVTDVDSVILATGYRHIVPFLSAGDALVIDPKAKSHNTSHIHPPPPLPLTSNGKYMRPLYRHTMSLTIFATRVIADPSLVADRISLLRELEEDEERLRRAGYDPDKRAHSLIDFTGQWQEANIFMDGIIDFLKEKNVTGLPLLGSGGRYVEDWRRRTDDLPTLIQMFFTWRELEKRGEAEKMVAGRRTEEDWIELLDYMAAHPLPPTPDESDLII